MVDYVYEGMGVKESDVKSRSYVRETWICLTCLKDPSLKRGLTHVRMHERRRHMSNKFHGRNKWINKLFQWEALITQTQLKVTCTRLCTPQKECSHRTW